MTTTFRHGLAACLAIALVGCRSAGSAGRPVLVQPGAPGEPTRAVSATDARNLSRIFASDADVQFMQGMIVHHAQAVEMTGLLRTRTNRADMRLLAGRLEASQTDEMAFMRGWLTRHGKDAPSEHAHHMPGGLMPGMLSAGEMAALGAASGATFDRLFLEGMVKHHAGALAMVADLFASRGAAQDTEIFSFASDVDADQRIEIARMQELLAQGASASTR